MYRNRFGRVLACGALCAIVALQLVSCGEETTPTQTTAPTDMEDLQNGMNQLVTFGEKTLTGDEAQVLTSPAIGDLLGSIGLPGLELPIASTSQAALLGWLRQDVVRKARTPLRPRVANLDNHFGTYERDVNDSTEPFQGWVLISAGEPADGLIFQFDLQDDIFTLDQMGNEVPLQGAVRFLNIVVDEGEPVNPEDDILTNIVFELAALPVMGTPPNLVRANLHITLDGNRDPASVTLGSPEANNTLHPDAAFLGNLLVALSVEITTPPSKPLNNLTAFAQLFDSVDNFALRFDLGLTGIDFASELPPTSMTIRFAFGKTATPANPPWSLAVRIDEFTPDQQIPPNYNASVDGSIQFNGDELAAFAGNTQEIPVDINGNGQFELGETCPDIDFTFSDDPESFWNICVVLPFLVELGDSLPSALAF